MKIVRFEIVNFENRAIRACTQGTRYAKETSIFHFSQLVALKKEAYDIGFIEKIRKECYNMPKRDAIM
jgi:hypothetical protein